MDKKILPGAMGVGVGKCQNQAMPSRPLWKASGCWKKSYWGTFALSALLFKIAHSRLKIVGMV